MSRAAQQHSGLTQQARSKQAFTGVDRTPAPRPWYKEPWPWIIMAGPALAIVACAITIVLAVQNFSDVAITDGGVKRGLVVERTDATKAVGAESEQKAASQQQGPDAAAR
ncbi:FixH family protein [Alcaligenaceae bacterium]|nr:FixH family protein [Alcaligenaceae bacterium]